MTQCTATAGEAAAAVQAAIENAPQALFGVVGWDAAFGQVPDVLAALQGAGARMVMEARLAQIVRHGHSAAADAGKPLSLLPGEAAREIDGAIRLIVDYLASRASSPVGDADAERCDAARRRLRTATRKLARGAALAMAGVDRLIVEEAKLGARESDRAGGKG